MNYSIGTKLIGGTALMFALIGTLGYFALDAMQTRESADADYLIAQNIVRSQTEMISAQRGIVVGGFANDAAEVGQYRPVFYRYRDENRKAAEHLRRSSESSEVRILTAELLDKVAEWQGPFESLVAKALSGDGAQAYDIRVKIARPIYTRAVEIGERIKLIETGLAENKKQDQDQRHARSRWISIALLGLCLSIGIAQMLATSGVVRDLRKIATRLHERAEEVAGAAVQVSSGSQSLADDASRQAASLQETSASTRDVSSAAQNNRDGSKQAADLVLSSQRKFEEANVSLDEMVAAMHEINTSSDKISKIIRVIDEIAFQTNILALNAAVEAARAGEAGLGFAVVAEEVRNLAQRSATAARDTASLIEGSIGASQAGTSKVSLVATAIREIAEETKRVKTLVDDVNSGSQEQAKGLDMVGKTLSQIEQLTMRTAASAEESAAAAQDLTSQSKSLKTIVQDLTSMVGTANSISYGGR